MEKRKLGRTGMEVTVLGLGAAEIGFEGVPAAVVEKLLHEALDAGLNVIDTAECYANSEELIGNAASRRRQDFYLFTKCGHTGKSFDPPMEDWDVRMLDQSIDRSLRRLKTDHVDLLQLHSCSEEMLRQGEVIRVVERAKTAGKTRFIGYSGDGDAARYAVDSGLFDTLQTSINIADQAALDLTLIQALEKDIGVIAKRPLANVAWRGKEGPINEYHRPYWERLQKLDYPFLKKPLSEAIGFALRFTLSCPAVSTAIVGTSKPGRWQENAAMVEVATLDSIAFNEIRVQWEKVAEKAWVGQT